MMTRPDTREPLLPAQYVNSDTGAVLEIAEMAAILAMQVGGAFPGRPGWWSEESRAYGWLNARHVISWVDGEPDDGQQTADVIAAYREEYEVRK
jgi:hypothetical protein